MPATFLSTVFLVSSSCGGQTTHLVRLLPEVCLYLVQPVLELPVVHGEHAQLPGLLLGLGLGPLPAQLLLVQLGLQVPAESNREVETELNGDLTSQAVMILRLTTRQNFSRQPGEIYQNNTACPVQE